MDSVVYTGQRIEMKQHYHTRQSLLAKTFVLLSLATALNASALVSVGGKNTTAEGAGAGWDYVGQVGTGGGSGIYLGHYGGEHWVLTAMHVSAHDFLIGGESYSVINGSGVRVGTYDLLLYRITVPDEAPLHSLPNLRLTNEDTDIMLNAEVTMIGFGSAGQHNTITDWQVDTDSNPPRWTIGTSGGDESHQGITYSPGTGKSWGTNHVINCEATYEENPNAYMLTMLDNVEGDSQGVVGDSGGGVFYLNPKTGLWELAGIMDMVSTYENQPYNSVMMGNETYIIPMVSHIDEIGAILGYDFRNQPVPEPASAMLALAGAAMLGWRRNARRA